jgi:hypothetical protein
MRPTASVVVLVTRSPSAPWGCGSSPVSRSAWVSVSRSGVRTSVDVVVCSSMNSVTVWSGEQMPMVDDDEAVGGEFHFAHEVAGEQHGASFGGEVAHEGAGPADAFGVETVEGLVEDEDVGVAEQCGGDAQALLHAE